MVRKCLSLSIIIALILTCAAVNTAAAGQMPKKNSLNSLLISGLGIMDKQNIAAQEITKAQFIAMTCRILGLGLVNKAESIMFSDVPNDMPEAGYIKAAFDLGIIEGNGNNMFMPNKPITSGEASKVLINALGYKPSALAKGGWPGGYLAVASEIGLYKDIEIKEGFTGSNCAVMLYNAINVKLMKPNGDGKYITTKNTLIDEAFKVNRLTGMVTGDSRVSLLGQEEIKDGYITIDGVKYLQGESEASELLGCVVDFYYNFNNNDERVIIAATPVNGCDILDIASEDIVAGTDINQVQYIDFDGEQKKIKTDIKAAIYNGTRIAYSLNVLVVNNGNVRFIDSEGDGIYDVLILNSYNNYVVDSASKSKIIDKYGKPMIDIDPNDPENIVVIKKGGVTIEANMLNEWDVLSVEQSEHNGKKYKYITVSSNQISGSITEIEKNADNTVKWMLIDDFPYKLDYSYNNALYSNQLYRLTPGDKNIFLLDYKNVIVGIKNKAGSEEEYAYLLSVGRVAGVENSYQIKVVNQNGSTVIYKLDDNVDFIGRDLNSNIVKAAITNEALFNILSSLNNNSTATKLIKLKTNPDGYITGVRTANATGYDITDGVNTYYKCATGAKLVYRPSSHSFRGYFGIDNNTKVFVVEQKSSGTVVTVFPSSFFKGDNIYHSVEAIDVDNLGVAGVIIKYPDQGGGMVDAGSYFFVIDTVTDALNEDGTGVKRLNGYYNYSKKSVNIADKYVLNSLTIDGTRPLKRGDVLQIALNSENEVTDALRLTIPPANNLTNEGAVGEIAYGRILTRSPERLMLETGQKGAGFWSSSGKISRPYSPLTAAYYYNITDDRLEIIKPEEIEAGWYAYIHSTYDKVFEIICFKQNQ